MPNRSELEEAEFNVTLWEEESGQVIGHYKLNSGNNDGYTKMISNLKIETIKILNVMFFVFVKNTLVYSHGLC